jgi:hypothetical protein
VVLRRDVVLLYLAAPFKGTEETPEPSELGVLPELGYYLRNFTIDRRMFRYVVGVVKRSGHEFLPSEY